MTTHDGPVADQMEFRWTSGSGYSPSAWSPQDPRRRRALELEAQDLAEPPASQRTGGRQSVVYQVRPTMQFVILRQYTDLDGRPDPGGRNGMGARVLSSYVEPDRELAVGLFTALGLLAGGINEIPSAPAGSRGATEMDQLTEQQLKKVRQVAYRVLDRPKRDDDYPLEWRAPLIAALLNDPQEYVDVYLPDPADMTDLSPNWQLYLTMDVLRAVHPVLSGFPRKVPDWALSFSSYEDQRSSRSQVVPRITFFGPTDFAPVPDVQRPHTAVRLRRDRILEPAGFASELADELAFALGEKKWREIPQTLWKLTEPREGYENRIQAVRAKLASQFRPEPVVAPAPVPTVAQVPAAEVEARRNNGWPGPYNGQYDKRYDKQYGRQPDGHLDAPGGGGPVHAGAGWAPGPVADSPPPGGQDPVPTLTAILATDPEPAFQMLQDQGRQCHREMAAYFPPESIPARLQGLASRIVVLQLWTPGGVGRVQGWLRSPETPLPLVTAFHAAWAQDPRRQTVPPDLLPDLEGILAPGRGPVRDQYTWPSHLPTTPIPSGPPVLPASPGPHPTSQEMSFRRLLDYVVPTRPDLPDVPSVWITGLLWVIVALAFIAVLLGLFPRGSAAATIGPQPVPGLSASAHPSGPATGTNPTTMVRGPTGHSASATGGKSPGPIKTHTGDTKKTPTSDVPRNPGAQQNTPTRTTPAP